VKIVCFALLATSYLSAIDSFSTYQRASAYYDHSWQQTSVALDALDRIAFRGDEKLLEIGCRGGRMSANLAGRIAHGTVVGAEMRGEGAIAFAQKNHSEQLYPNLSFVAQDFRTSTEENSYDWIVSFSSLHWYKNQSEILDRVFAALKPSGRIFFTIPCIPLPEVQSAVDSVRENEKWASYFTDYVHPRHKFTVEQYQGFLEQAGFQDPKVAIERHSYFFANKRDLIDWLSAFTPLLDNIPEEMHQDFLTDFANAYTVANPITSTGHIPFHQDELFIQAQK